jgi:acetolactate synthase small subunit
VTQIEKKIDVIQAHYFTDKEIFQREVAMYKVATPEFQANPEASKVIRRYSAHIVEVNPTFSIVEMVGMSDDITSIFFSICVTTLSITSGVVQQVMVYLCTPFMEEADTFRLSMFI